jgi:hypothetical protein
MECIVYELKYCERCGRLALRGAHSAATYCKSCAQVLANIFAPKAPSLFRKTSNPACPERQRAAGLATARGRRMP